MAGFCVHSRELPARPCLLSFRARTLLHCPTPWGYNDNFKNRMNLRSPSEHEVKAHVGQHFA
jgi:hypothetical protein